MQKTATRRGSGWIKRMQPYLFVSPFFLIYAVFGLYPFISGILFSLQNKAGDIGLMNYTSVLTDTRFWKAIINALLYTASSVFIILPVALLAALMLNSRFIGKKSGFVSTAFFIPSATSVIVIGIVFKLMLRANGGVFNAIITSLGFKSLNFLSDPRLALVSLTIIGIWRYFGVNSLYFLSGLQGIPVDVGEASRIDGATRIQEFFYITLPLLKPIMAYIVFTAITGSFAIFGEIMSLLGTDSTGARDSFLYPVVYLYMSMFKNNKMYFASAMGYCIAAILFVVTSVQRKLFSDKD